MGCANSSSHVPSEADGERLKDDAWKNATSVKLLQNKGQPYGVTIKPSGNAAVILNLKPHGRLMKAWQEQNPGVRLQPGCKVVSVNGMSGNYNILRSEIAKPGLKELKVEEGSVLENCPRLSADEVNADECAICFEDYEPECVLAQLKCGHAFHEECIGKWFSHGRGSCPLCAQLVLKL